MLSEKNNASKTPYIIVGEDDIFLSKVYKTKLVKEGFKVGHATNGEELLKLAREKKPDLILCDLIMPIKDGFEALKDLRADPVLKDVKVVILSNLSQEADQKRVMDMGAAEYIVKANVSFGEVIKAVKKHLAE